MTATGVAEELGRELAEELPAEPRSPGFLRGAVGDPGCDRRVGRPRWCRHGGHRRRARANAGRELAPGGRVDGSAPAHGAPAGRGRRQRHSRSRRRLAPGARSSADAKARTRCGGAAGRRAGRREPRARRTRRRGSAPARPSTPARDRTSGADPAPDDDDDVDVRLVAAVVRGNARLLAGMLRANRPWRLIARLSRALAAAGAALVFALVTAEVWDLAAALSPWRLGALSVISMAAVVVFLILVHGLWKRRPAGGVREQAILFNVATTLTLIIGVASLCCALFVIALGAGELMLDHRVVSRSIGAPCELRHLPEDRLDDELARHRRGSPRGRPRERRRRARSRLRIPPGARDRAGARTSRSAAGATRLTSEDCSGNAPTQRPTRVRHIRGAGHRGRVPRGRDGRGPMPETPAPPHPAC